MVVIIRYIIRETAEGVMHKLQKSQNKIVFESFEVERDIHFQDIPKMVQFMLEK